MSRSSVYTTSCAGTQKQTKFTTKSQKQFEVGRIEAGQFGVESKERNEILANLTLEQTSERILQRKIVDVNGKEKVVLTYSV